MAYYYDAICKYMSVHTDNVMAKSFRVVGLSTAKTIPISIFINNYILSNTFNYQKVENILAYIVNCMFGVKIDSNKKYPNKNKMLLMLKMNFIRF